MSTLEKRAQEELQRKSGTKTTKCPPLPFQPLAEINADARQESVQGLFGPGSVAALLGQPNFGKTFSVINLALHVAAGVPWFGRKVRRCPVAYFAPEAPGSVAMRTRAAVDAQFPSKTLPFYLIATPALLGDEQHGALATEQVIATCEAIASTEGEPIGLILFDTVAASMGSGEENNTGMMALAQNVRRIAERIQAAVVLLHHPSKADSTSLRGHGSLAGACDTILAVSIDDATGIRTITVTKSRDFATGVLGSFKLEVVPLATPDSFGDPRTTCIICPTATPTTRQRPKGKAQEQLLNELERRHRTGETNWSLATVRDAAKSLGIHRNTYPKLPTALRAGGFLRGPDSNLTLAYPPEDAP